MVEAGDYVIIKSSVIDNKVMTLLTQNQNKAAARWESYRNSAFEVIAVDEHGIVTLQDAQGHKLQISKRSYDIVNVSDGV